MQSAPSPAIDRRVRRGSHGHFSSSASDAAYRVNSFVMTKLQDCWASIVTRSQSSSAATEA